MDTDESSIQSFDDSDMMIVAEVDSRKKRKLRAEESSLLLPQPKHYCQEQEASLPESSCPSSDIESPEHSYTTAIAKTRDGRISSYSTGSSGSSSGYATSSVDQCCSIGNGKAQEYIEEDLSLMEFICPEFTDEVLSAASWHVTNQDSEETKPKPTIDQEFEDYFSELMM